MGVTHFDDAPAHTWEVGHIRGRWTLLGEAAASDAVGVRRIELPESGWSTPVHEHGRSEEIFYVLAGQGLVWHAGQTTPVTAGDCVLFAPGSGGHTMRGGDGGLDFLAFGTRERDESPAFPRLRRQLLGRLLVGDAEPRSRDGVPMQFLLESQEGPPSLPDSVGERPRHVIALDALEPVTVARARTERTRRNFGRALGSEDSGLQHVVVAPGRESTAPHCHSCVEELFVMLDGDGTVVLGDEEVHVRAGSVVARPAGTGVPHVFRGGEHGLTYLAYSNRDHADICWYPRSRKVGIRGIGVAFRVEPIEDYWDGEE